MKRLKFKEKLNNLCLNTKLEANLNTNTYKSVF